jgi:hypothetical protein
MGTLIPPLRIDLARKIERTSDRKRLGHPPLGGAVANHHVHLVHASVEDDLCDRASAGEALKARPANCEFLERRTAGLQALTA